MRNAIHHLLNEYPEYGYFISGYEVEIDTTIPTIGVSVVKAGFKIYYNPEWFDEFNLKTKMELLKHELLHILYGHVFIDNKDYDNTLLNIAEDMIINRVLNKELLPPGGYFLENYNLENRDYNLKELYNLLLNNDNNNNNSESSEDSSEDNSEDNKDNSEDNSEDSKEDNTSDSSDTTNNDSSNTSSDESSDSESSEEPNRNNNSDSNKPSNIGTHDRFNQDNLDKESLEESQMMLNEDIKLAFEKFAGNLPGGIEIDLSNDKVKTSQTYSWVKKLKSSLFSLRNKRGYRKTWLKPNIRFEDPIIQLQGIKPNGSMPRLLIAIDCSGSMDNIQLSAIINELKKSEKHFLGDVLSFDTKVYDDNIIPLTDFNIKNRLYGRGGTEFKPVVDFYNENYIKNKYAGLIIASDMYCSSTDLKIVYPKNTIFISVDEDVNKEHLEKKGVYINLKF